MTSPERPTLFPVTTAWTWHTVNWWGVLLSASSAALMLVLVWLLIS